jgi:phenylpropionate dioxygenase-like ring-hydroxylating dioxygenase large terminal subunit
MDRDRQQELLGELIELHEARSPYLDEAWEQPGMARYHDPAIFALERERIFHGLPQIAAHSSELPRPGAFLRVDCAGKPLLLVRGEDGEARAFYNVCRHRGARLVDDPSGCKKRFSCPYHAWTWDGSGQLVGVPHEKSGFPGLQREDFGLHTVACEEFGGWIWIHPGAQHVDVRDHLGELRPEIEALDAGAHVIFESTVKDIDCNWKILVEGGLEAYHFRVAHRDTIAPLFLDNLSSYRCLGRHIRSVLPRSTLPDMAGQPRDQWDIRKHSNLLYTLFPGPQFLVQEDHFVWIQGTPLSPGRTRLRLCTVIPAGDNTPEKAEYWRRNHALTLFTLDEDFALGESIQQGLASGANEHLNFGRFEGALARFNRFVDEALDAPRVPPSP